MIKRIIGDYITKSREKTISSEGESIGLKIPLSVLVIAFSLGFDLFVLLVENLLHFYLVDL